MIFGSASILKNISFLLALLQQEALANNTTSSKVFWSNHTEPHNGFTTQNLSVSQATTCHMGVNSAWVLDSLLLPPQADGGRVDYIAGYEEFCALWNSSCEGDLDIAFRNFEKSVSWIRSGSFYDCGQQILIGTASLPQKSRIQFSQLSNYAQSPQCTSRYRDIHCPGFSVTSQLQCRGSVFPAVPCCGSCTFDQAVVDLFYWPSEVANTSCLSIISDTVQPLDQDVTTLYDIDRLNNKTFTNRFYGCTTMSRASNGSTIYQFAITAQRRILGTLTFKAPWVNPWKNNVSCVRSKLATPVSHYSKVSAAPIQVRAHSLVNGTGTSNNTAHSLGRVAVSDGFTFTSPSVYLKIYNLTAWDGCGEKPGAISTTMVALHPNELSSIAGAPLDPYPTTSRFNLADLPCPPMSVMMKNWYMPKPGEPYIPIIAWPSVLQLNSPWNDCVGASWFVGYDPPRTLTPADGIVPVITPDPTSDPVQTTEGTRNGHGGGKLAAPAAIPRPDQPTITMGPKIPSFLTMIDPQVDPHAASSDPGAHATESLVQLANPVSRSQDSGDAMIEEESLTRARAHGSHSRNGAKGGVIDPSPGIPQQHPSETHPGSFQLRSTAKQQTESDSGNEIHHKTESLKDFDSKQQQATMKELLSEQPKSVVAALDPHVKPSITYQTYNIEPSTAKVMEIQDQALQFTSGKLLYDGSTIGPGDSAKTVSGIFISFDHEGHLQIGTEVIHVPRVESAIKSLARSSDNSPIGTLSNGLRVVLGATLTPGAPVVSVSGVTMSLDKSDNLVVASQAKSPPTASNANQPMNSVVADQKVTPLSQEGTQFSESPITVSGTPLSPGFRSSVLNTKTVPSPANPGRPSLSWTVIAGQTVTPLPNAVALAGTRLKPKDPAITISGTAVSLDSTALIVNSKPITLSPMRVEPISTVIEGQTVTIIPGEVLVDNETLSPGGTALTVSGNRVSVNNHGNVIVGGTLLASGSAIQAVITTETGVISASVSSGSQSANGTIALNAFEGTAAKVGISIAYLITATLGFIAIYVL